MNSAEPILSRTGDNAVAPWARRWWPTVVLILGVTVARLAYLAWLCPYTLLEDEAQYWEWSRRLDWSYYSKGPGIAWSIFASTWLAGDTEFGIRLSAVVAGAVAAIAVAALADDVFHDRRAAFFATACMLLTPAFQFGGVLATIDMPYGACWAVACLAAWRALSRGSRWAWPALGIALGLGFLYKYTILLLIPGLVLFAIVHRSRLRVARPALPWIVFGAALLVAGMVPVLVWNAARGWPTVAHLFGHLGLAAGDQPVAPRAPCQEYSPSWTFGFLGAQLGLIGPVLLLMGASIARARDLSKRAASPGAEGGWAYLVWCAAPILIFYTLLTFFTEVEGNWAVAGYLSLVALCGWGAIDGLARRRAAGAWRAGRNLCATGWKASLVVGLLMGAISLRFDLIAGSVPVRWLEARLVAFGWLKPGRTLVPVGRLTGARAMVNDVTPVLADLRERTGQEPFIIADHYGRAALLAFYLPGQPVVYCSSSIDGEGRRTQWDFWPETDLRDLAVLGGRPAVMVGSRQERWARMFGEVVGLGRLPNETKRERDTFVGLGYKGP